MTSATTDAPPRSIRSRASRVALVVLVPALCPVLFFAGQIAVDWAPTWWSLWRDAHPGVSVPASTDAARLAVSVLPSTWDVTGSCVDHSQDRCARYEGRAEIRDQVSASAAHDEVIARVREAGLSARETFCRPVPDGATQCLVRAVANRGSSDRLVSYLAFVRVGPHVGHMTFTVEAP